MKVIHKLRMDLARCGCRPVVGAVQGEANARVLEVSLYDSGVAWEIPEAAVVDVAYQKPDGTQGIYSKLPDGTPATTFSGNELSATLAPQMLTIPGSIRAAFVFHLEGQATLATFPFLITVEANPAAGAERSEDYYNPSVGDIEAEIRAALLEVQGAHDAAARSEAAAQSAQAALSSMTPEKIGAAPASHASDKTNPHGVTAAQVGALPSCVAVTTAGTDLNDYLEEGWYFFHSAYVPTNIPVGKNGWLCVSAKTVGSATYVKQIWYRAGTPGNNDHQMYVRTYISAADPQWGDWVQIYTAKDTLSSTEINTLVNNGKTKVVLLWQNASPSSAFEGDQYIDLGEGNTSSVYDCAIVLCRYSTGLGHMAQSDLLKQNLGASVYYPKGYVSEQATRWFRRDGGADGRYLYVSHGFADGSQSNGYCIPYQVYGIKW
jgi:hypothetical protein